MSSSSSFLKSAVLVCASVFLFVGSLFAQNRDFNYFFPSKAQTFNKEILSPEAFFGAKTAEMHLTYEMVYSYMTYLERVSNRVVLETLGMTYESKPFSCATITSAANIKNLEAIREAHLEEITTGVKSGSGSVPTVSWLGYSVHGNEASGINASVVVAYVLAACEDKYITDILDNSVVLLLPALNPDGCSRYANWVNSNISFAKNTDVLNREGREPSPGSRSNHYWFDLNRDWLLAVHPEGRAILKALHHWQPTIVSDFHEQGTATGTFFSPGIESKTNKVIFPSNWEMTNKIAAFHQSYMEDIGTLYFSRDAFDDFYPGKGGCYPDLLGTIGILYEQPNPRGLNRVRELTELSLAVSVRNQIFCSFSALDAAVTLREDLREYRRNYLKWQKSMFAQFSGKGYVFTTGNDISMGREFTSLLDAHGINYSLNSADISAGGVLYAKEQSFIVPLEQSTISVIRTIFETELEFKDSTFYDISGWTPALAYNLKYNLVSIPAGQISSSNNATPVVREAKLPLVKKAGFAYLFEMDDFYSYNFLYYLLNKGVYLKASDAQFHFKMDGKTKLFSNGTVMIPTKLQKFSEEELHEIITSYFKKVDELGFVVVRNETPDRGFIEKGLVKVYSVDSGAGQEFDLGSERFRWISKPSIAILVGSGASYGSVGEIWHLLDYKFRIPVTLLDNSSLSAATLSNYNVIILVNDMNLSKSSNDELTTWARRNTLITIGGGVQFANRNNLTNIKFGSVGREPLDSSLISYAYNLFNRRSSAFTGVVLSTKIDLSHPLAIGLKDATLPVFKGGSLVLDKSRSPYSIVSRLSSKPLLSGYMTPAVVKSIKETPYLISQRGLVFFPDNPNFRGYWLGTSRTFMNAILFRELL